MKNKAVFLDRDGTLNFDKGYTHKVEDLKIIPRVVEGLKILQDAEYKLIIVTNQSGIGRGYFTKDDYYIFKNYLHEKLKESDIKIDAEYFCPHRPDEGCNCRKPKTDMLEKAAKDFHLDLRECWIIGDSVIDIQVGKNGECKTIHVITGECKEPIQEANFVAKDLLEAASYILEQDDNK